MITWEMEVSMMRISSSADIIREQQSKEEYDGGTRTYISNILISELELLGPLGKA